MKTNTAARHRARIRISGKRGGRTRCFRDLGPPAESLIGLMAGNGIETRGDGEDAESCKWASNMSANSLNEKEYSDSAQTRIDNAEKHFATQPLVDDSAQENGWNGGGQRE